MRLTNTTRQGMLNTIVAEKADPRVAKVKKKLETIAQQTADTFYPKSVKDWIDAAPNGVLAFHNRSSIYLADGKACFGHALLGRRNGYRNRNLVTLKKSLKVLAGDQYTDELQVSARNAKRLAGIKEELDAIEQDRDALHQVITSALWACNTRKQLEANYPALVKYLPKIEKQTKALAVTAGAVAEALM